MIENKRRCFLVTAMCGHVGKRKYIPVNFAVYAENASDAAQLVKTFSRVKKHRKDAILSCVEITVDQYLIQKDINRRDPYLNAKCHADASLDDSIYERICSIEGKRRKEKRPFSMKYRAWKAEGRRIFKLYYEGD